jgi:hypothetical protein
MVIDFLVSALLVQVGGVTKKNILIKVYYYYYYYCSFGIAMGYGLDSRSSILTTGKRFLYIPYCPDWLWSPFSLLSGSYGRIFCRE